MDRKRKINIVDNFRTSTSLFRSEEEYALKVDIISTNDYTKVFETCVTENTIINKNLTELLLSEYAEENIKSYVPSKDDKLTTNQRKFLIKLRQVLINNDPDSEAPNCEKFIDELMYFLCDQAELDDGLELTMRPCNLKLLINTESFSAIADREGRRGQELAFIIQEDKHRKSSTYKHGDLQIACAMIAAIQQNYQLVEKIHPEKMMGIKVVADKIYFCSIKPTLSYIESLYSGLPSHKITMYKFPTEGFCLSNPIQRKYILQYMTILRKEATY